MSALIDHAVFDMEARTRHPAAGARKSRREAEFQMALDSYMAGYRKHGAIGVSKGSGGRRIARSALIRKIAAWISRQFLGFDAACSPKDTRAGFTNTPFW
ncbi:hypothetical protein LB557_05615 [Mesorhizobium sp. BR115XR7A]|uniref:hypothetical protein n=1 Tax=Mesorhizobium sp. BR115XR7A TaxID=2876645 RepID=UPI001CCC4E61|nr:hypothetical protein [Mesorhizobium sp. BR115XR7A]MBZ9905480.1 hypothetical protein [Mesorhizobium sp. BR115XR7A]MBZ9929570.1 hypothetical protein [Mesorhizobium sp. BR1-1-5]